MTDEQNADSNAATEQPQVQQETTVVTERTETPAPAENDPNAQKSPGEEVGLDTAELVNKAEEIATESRESDS